MTHSIETGAPDAASTPLRKAVDHCLNTIEESFALIDRDGRVQRANISFRRLTGPAGGAHDASILSFLHQDHREAGRLALTRLDAANPIRSMKLLFQIGRDTRLVDVTLTWLGEDGWISFVGRDVTQQDILERERKETTDARQALEQACDIGHWRVGRDMKVVCSAGASRLLGTDPSGPSLLVADLADMVLPEDRSAVTAAVRSAYENRRTLRLDFRFRRPDGQVRQLRVAGSPAYNAFGQIEAMHGVVSDQTSMQDSILATLNARTTVSRMFDGIPVGALICDREMRIIFANPQLIANAGRPASEVVGRNLYDVFPWIPEKWRRVHKLALRGEAYQTEREGFEGPDGSQRFTRWGCAPWMEGGAIGGVILTGEDVTEAVEAQHGAEASKERMAFGLSMTSTMIWELDFERREVVIEGDWKNFFPAMPTFDTLAGEGNGVHPNDRDMLASKWKSHLAGGPAYTAEYRVYPEEGRLAWHSATVRILRTVKGSPARAIAVIQDITDRKAIEQKALDAEQRALVASAAKSDFLSNMSHEIRTPLNGVLAVSEMLARSNLDERQAEMVRLVTTSGRTLLRVMDDLVEFSRLEADKIEFEVRPFELEDALRSACESASTRAEAKGLTFTTFLSASLDGVFRGDPSRVGQIVGNLLNNAVKFTEKGSVSLSAAVDDSGPRSIVKITVSDTGVGFSPEFAARIFDRFEKADLSTSRKFGGLGLGLSIVKRLVDLMGGTISATSEEGMGSTFEVLIPLPRDRIAALGAIQAVEVEDFEAETKIENIRMLVAEDNPMNRRVIELLLAQSGVHITFAENGREAVEKYTGGTFDLVLMDLQMPIMGGLAAMQAIRAWEKETGRPRTPMLAVSANATDDHVHEAKEAGADDHVAKPIVRETLFEAIARYARNRTGGQSGAPADADEFDLDDLDIAI
jgi:PAS domain S-box-containing protein